MFESRGLLEVLFEVFSILEGMPLKLKHRGEKERKKVMDLKIL